MSSMESLDKLQAELSGNVYGDTFHTLYKLSQDVNVEHAELMAQAMRYVRKEKVEPLEAENANLRELIGDLREYIAGNADACDFCPQLGTCENHPAPPPCKYELTTKDDAVLDYIADSLRELGVEL